MSLLRRVICLRAAGRPSIPWWRCVSISRWPTLFRCAHNSQLHAAARIVNPVTVVSWRCANSGALPWYLGMDCDIATLICEQYCSQNMGRSFDRAAGCNLEPPALIRKVHRRRNFDCRKPGTRQRATNRARKNDGGRVDQTRHGGLEFRARGLCRREEQVAVGLLEQI